MKLFFRLFFLFIFLQAFVVASSAGAEDRLHLLYFFTATCPHCKQATPVVSQLSAHYNIQGIVYGRENPGPLPFPVRQGTREEVNLYHIEGVPSLVVLSGGKVKYVFIGEQSIRDAPVLLNAFRGGALSVSEALAQGPGGDYTMAGWIISRGEYFNDAHFFLTDRKKQVPVQPWLPLEAVKSPFKKARPRLMSDVIDRPVVLKGTLIKSGAGLLFLVKEEVRRD